MNSRDVLGRKD